MCLFARRSRAASCFVINMMVPSVTHVMNLVMTFASSSHWDSLVTDEEYADARAQQQQQECLNQHGSSSKNSQSSVIGSRHSKSSAAQQATDGVMLNSSNGSCQGGAECYNNSKYNSSSCSGGGVDAGRCGEVLLPQSSWTSFDHALYR